MNKFLKLAVPGVQSLQPYLPGKPIEELERELGLSGSIKLASNENPLGPGKKALAAAQATLNQINFYPDGGGHKLRLALADKHNVSPDFITLGNGSNDILELIARAFLAPCYAAAYSEYAFAVYPIVTQAIGAEHQVAPAFPADHPDMPYGHDLVALAAKINNSTRVVFIANPNNPTGTWLDSHQLESFIADVSDDVVIVLDEAYFEYMPEQHKPDSDALVKKYPHLIITRTFSKIYGLAGLRIGYAISHPDIADLLNRVRQPFNTNLVAQSAALAAIDDVEHLNKSIELNNAGLEQLRHGLSELGISCIPSIGNFITADMHTDAAPIYQALLQEGVIVRPVANYKMPDHLRITIGTADQNSRLLVALKKVLS
ncbi:MAG: histidinol-phosphate transaminase [Gammaproteobacteria bacterium]|nr:histidinol-phosphate transaminase [Gammaproteobacteria bacterium]